MNTSGKSRTGYQGATIALLAALLIGLPAGADDTELYFTPAPLDAPAPLIMLTLDLRSSLIERLCARKDDITCVEDVFGTDENGAKIYAELDMASSEPVSQVDGFKAALRAVIRSDLGDGKRIGLMLSHDSGNNSCTTGSTNCSQGGYVVRGFELFLPDDANGAKDELVEIIKDIPLTQGAAAHSYKGLSLFLELYRYLAGLNVLHGKLGYTDYQSKNPGGTGNRNLDYEFSTGFGSPPATKCAFTVGTNSGDNRRCLGYIDPATGYTPAAGSNLASGTPGVRIPSTLTWDPTILRNSGNSYTSPYNNGEDWSCSGTYTINMLFGVSDDGGNGDPTKSAAGQSLVNYGLGLTGNPTFTQIIAKLKNFDHADGDGQATGVPNVDGPQTVTSYFLTPDTGPTKGQVRPYADASGTKVIPALGDPRALFEAFTNIFGQINAVSSSFVAVTVPVNADNRVTSLPNLFVALFQVDEGGKPFWPGNLKKLDIVTTTDPFDGSKQLEVQDALGKLAFSDVTGRLKDKTLSEDAALTLWTVPTAADVVAFDAAKDEQTGKDGGSVRRGGAGHKIPGYISGSVGENNSIVGARQIFLEPAAVTGTAAAGNPMVELNASSGSGLLADVSIQDLLGIHATSLTAACPGRDASNYCITFIDEVLTAAGQATTGAAATKASTATRLFLRWIRGFDVFNEAGAPGPWDGLATDPTPTPQRKWMMGDVLHSRPLAVNYGARTGYSEDNQDVRLIFGSNDGMLRMVRNTAPGTPKPSALTQQSAAYGQEVWAFMPRELLAHVPELAMNFGNVGLNRPYGADGQPTLFTIDTNGDGIIENDGSCTVGADDCDRAWVYFGLRRGGKSYYAVDISNPQATTPNLLWKIDDSPPDFNELGMTFSSPRVGWVRFEDDPDFNLFDLGDGEVNVPVPVVIFGGGYHGHAVTTGDHHQSGTGGPSKDTILGTPFTGADTDQGNAIFIVHARSGELIWKATLGASTGAVGATEYAHVDMQHGIAAPVSPMDSDSDGILDRLYVADTGGRVWRVDLPEFVPGISASTHRRDTWKATMLADLRPADLSATPNDDLRFFHGATLVRRARDGVGVYDAIAVGSGDREHPQSETNKDNWFFLLKDRRITSGDTTSFTAYKPADLLDITNQCFAGSSITSSCDVVKDPGTGAVTSAPLANGWRLALEATGEKNLSEPFIGGNGIIFTTYLPGGKVLDPDGNLVDDAKCVPLGASRLYQVSLETGAPLRFLHGVEGDTFSKDHRWINLYSGIDGGVVAVSPDFWITSSGKSGKNPPQKPVGFYWRESGVDTVK
jgi:type IV pilus assembly protein PilY1